MGVAETLLDAEAEGAARKAVALAMDGNALYSGFVTVPRRALNPRISICRHPAPGDIAAT